MKLFIKRLFQLLAILFLVLIIYILYSNQKLKGTWVGIYNYSYNEYFDDKIFKNFNSVVVVFDGLKKEKTSFYDKDYKSNYFTFFNHFYSDPENELFDIAFTKIKHLNKDSLVLKNSIKHEAFRKVPDSLKNYEKINFKKQAFEITLNTQKDTVFIDDKDFLFKVYNPNNPYKEWRSHYFKEKRINDFSFLISEFFTVIMKQNNKKLKFYKFNQDSITELEVNKIELRKESLLKIQKEIRINNQLDSLYGKNK